MTFRIEIPSTQNSSAIAFDLAPGAAVIFVGANGGGKTRLAVRLENAFAERAHRIGAHRALKLNPSVAKIPEAQARSVLRRGSVESGHLEFYRTQQRWNKDQATGLLTDFDVLIQLLFVQHGNAAHITHMKASAGNLLMPEPTMLQRLAEIWSRLIPHREIDFTADDVTAKKPGSPTTYSAGQMSDGERSVFYMLGQVLVADPGSLLICDEPELHIHRAILDKLWDEALAARPDCSFVLITHDLDFAATRIGQKFTLSDYTPDPESWTIEVVPEETGFSETTTTLILGSRRPILFVEGTN